MADCGVRVFRIKPPDDDRPRVGRHLAAQGRWGARMMRLGPMALLVAVGCGSALGPVGLVASGSGATAVKLLRPAAVARVCRSSFLGIPLGTERGEMRDALARILALDGEGDVVTNAEVRVQWVTTGVYNRQCVEVRGDLARTIRTITVPSLHEPGEQGHHH